MGTLLLLGMEPGWPALAFGGAQLSYLKFPRGSRRGDQSRRLTLSLLTHTALQVSLTVALPGCYEGVFRDEETKMWRS